MNQERHFLVTIRGEWARRGTLPDDVRMMRKKIAPLGEFHVRKAKSEGQNLRGDFRVTIPVTRLKDGAIMWHYDDGQWAKRGRLALESALMDLTCRPPRLSRVEYVDHQATA